MRRTLFSLCVLCVLGGDSFAAMPTVESLTPGIGQRGTEFTFVLTGARLTNPQELMIYSPGVTCTKLTAKSENEVAVTLKAALDCKLGEYAFRLRTSGGASELRTFRITPFPAVLEKEPNDTTAQAVPLNTSIAGAIESAGVDNYTVTLKKGQRLSAEVEGIRLGVDVTDTVVTVFGPDGKELASADDTPLFRQDPFVSIIAPTDGVYKVQVRETNYGGGESNRYVLHVGTFPRPAAVFPAGGQAGTEIKVKLFGSEELTQTLKLPAAGTPFEFHPSDGTVAAPTPNPFRVSAFPNVIEAEPNDELKQAGKAVAWPVAFNGIIEKSGDVDHFRFRAAKGDVIDVQAFAFRIGSPLDPVVAVLDASGELIAGNDDDETHDSRVNITIPADGEYILRVADKRKQGGPRFIYRVELDKTKPGLTVFLPTTSRKSQERQVIAVPRGNRVTAYLGVRRDGCNGPVAIAPSELPVGLKATINTISADEYFVPVVLEAAADAPVGGKLISFTGKCSDKSVTGSFEQVIHLVGGPGDSAFHAVEVSQLAVVVVDEVPFSVSIVPPTAPLTADGTLDITVRVTRAADFTGPLDVSFSCLPNGVETPATVTIPANKNEAVITLVAGGDADIGDSRLIAEVQAARAGRGGRDPLLVGMNGLGTEAQPIPPRGGRRRRSAEGLPPVASELVALKVTESPVRGAFEPAAGEQGKTVKVICKLEAGMPQGSFTAKLDGLPPRAATQPITLKDGAKEIEFNVTIDATTPPGPTSALVCELTGTVSGQKVVYRVGRGGTLRVDVPGGVKTDASGKPLSPLDALRLEQKK